MNSRPNFWDVDFLGRPGFLRSRRPDFRFQTDGSLFRLGDHFNGVDQRVVYDRLELQEYVALFIGLDASEGLFQGAVGPAHFFEDVEVLQQRFAVTEDVKDAAAGPAADRIGSAEV